MKKIIMIGVVGLMLSGCSVRMGNQHLVVPNGGLEAGIGVSILEMNDDCRNGLRIFGADVGGNFEQSVCDKGGHTLLKSSGGPK